MIVRGENNLDGSVRVSRQILSSTEEWFEFRPNILLLIEQYKLGIFTTNISRISIFFLRNQSQYVVNPRRRQYIKILYADKIMQNDATRVVCATTLIVVLGIKVLSYSKIIFNYIKKVRKDDINNIVSGREIESS